MATIAITSVTVGITGSSTVIHPAGGSASAVSREPMDQHSIPPNINPGLLLREGVFQLRTNPARNVLITHPAHAPVVIGKDALDAENVKGHAKGRIYNDWAEVAKAYLKRNFPQTEADMTQAIDRVMAEAAKDWADIRLASQHVRRLLLWGPPGTGKSYLAAQVPNQAPLYRLYLTMDTPAAEVRGHYLPSKDGGFEWHDGPGVAAWRHNGGRGGRLGIDEIDAASGDTLTLLMGLLDDPETARLTLPTNETVRPGEDFSVVAATNQQPTVMPEALLDRFDCVFHVKYPCPDVFQPEHWTSEKLREAAKKMVYLPVEGEKRLAKGRPVGLRAFRAMDRLHASGLSVSDAARLVLGEEASRWLDTAMKIAA